MVIKNAPYNPRVMDTHSRKKLRDGIKRIGLVQPLVWNRRTGNLIAGHQRLAVLDDLERNKNYRLTVAVCDMDEKTEKETNVFLNNPSVMGEFDYEMLENMITNMDVDPINMGFDPAELSVLFEKDVLEENDAEKKLTKNVEKLIKAKKSKESFWDNIRKREEEDYEDYYAVVVFQTAKQLSDFLDKIGLESWEKYVDGNRIMTFLEEKTGRDPNGKDDRRQPKMTKNNQK